MNVRELLDNLTALTALYDNESLTVEVATCPRKDEWYEVSDVEVGINVRGEPVLVINTD